MPRANPIVNYSELIQQDSVNMNNGLNVRDDLKGLSVAQLQELSDKERWPFFTLALNLTGDLNISTIIRSSHLFGCSGVWIVGRRKYDKRGTVGAQNYVPIHRIDALLEDGLTFDVTVIEDLIRKNNMLPVFAETTGECLGKFSWKEKLAAGIEAGLTPTVILGNEGRGIPANVLAMLQTIPHGTCVKIPMAGVMRSFNVATAHSIICWDMCKEMGWFK
jgi:tRNA G18 (ribose-2'-O)-methylase SpoU